MAINTKVISNEANAFAVGNVNKVLIKFAIPAIISLFVAELYNMVDTLFVGRAIGAEAIGALSIAFPVQRFMISLGLLIAVGASTAVARSLGEGNKDKLKYILGNALTLMLIIIISLTIFIYLFMDSILIKLGTTSSIFPYAKDYISIVIFGGVFQCFTVIIGYMLTSLGNARANLIATSIGALCNVILDTMLVMVFPLGIKGAAIATVLSQIVSAIYAYYNFSKIKKEYGISINFNLNKEIIITIVAVGFSTFIIEISDAVVSVILNNTLADYGDTSIIVIGVISKVSMFMYITMLGITSAMQPIVAFNYGAKNYERVKEVVRRASKIAHITTFAMWTIMMIFANEIISCFVKEQDILNNAVGAFRIMISIFPIVGVYFTAIYYYQAIEESKISLVLSIFRQLLIFIPVVLVCVRIFGVLGVWISYPISDMISAITGYIYMKKGMKVLDEIEEQEEVSYTAGIYGKNFNKVRSVEAK